MMPTAVPAGTPWTTNFPVRVRPGRFHERAHGRQPRISVLDWPACCSVYDQADDCRRPSDDRRSPVRVSASPTRTAVSALSIDRDRLE